jgi:hypothetical protein
MGQSGEQHSMPVQEDRQHAAKVTRSIAEPHSNMTAVPHTVEAIPQERKMDEVMQPPYATAVTIEADSKSAALPADKKSRMAGLKPFIVMSMSYLLYTTTDGAIRMIVLLNAYQLGFTAW